MLAETWHIPPWEVEDAPDLWVQRWEALQEERNRAQSKPERRDSLI